MPLLVEEFVVGLAPMDAARACQGAAAEFGWRIDGNYRDEILIAIPPIEGGREPRLDVRFAPHDEGRTRVLLQSGIGLPAQSDTGDLRTQMLRMRASILSAVAPPTASQTSGNGAAGHPPERHRAPADWSFPAAPEEEAAALSALQLQIAHDLNPPRSSSSTRLIVLLVLLVIAAGALVSLQLSRGGGAAPSGGLTVQQVYSQVQKALQQGTLPQGTDTVNPP